jgi:predicted RNase H-like HicB family nuclease
MAAYIALLRKEEGSCYGVDFPDFPGCVTGADTLDAAYKRAAEVLDVHIRSMTAEGDDIPEPSQLESVLADPDNHGAIPFLVGTAPAKVRSIRLNVTLEEPLVKEIDKVTNNRSGFLAEGARLLLRQRV